VSRAGNKGTREQGNKGAREQGAGNKGTRIRTTRITQEGGYTAHVSLLDGKIERNAKRYTRKQAIAVLVAWCFFGATAAAQIIKFTVGRDSFYLFAGIFNLFITTIMIVFFVMILHRISRQNAHESSAPPTL
jgi:hypothetical protein